MKTMIGITLAALAMAAIGSAQDVHYNFDADANFAKYKTYKLVEIPGGAKLDELIARQLTTAVEAGLKAKGLSNVDSDTTDLVIGYQAEVTKERQVELYTTGGYRMGPRWGGGMATTSATTSTLLIGSVSVDMYEVGSKHLVWRGVATKTIDQNAKPDKRQKNIEKGVTKLLKTYPPKKK
jgi:hypothetical protein